MSAYGLGEPYGWGRSFQRPVRGTNPAAGAIYSVTLDGKYRRQLVDIAFTLTTDSNAANRYVTVEYLGGDGNPITIFGAAVTVSANSTQRFVGQRGRALAEWAANTDVFFPVAPVFLDSGTFRINVAAIQAGDTLTLIYYHFDEFPTADSVLPEYGSVEGNEGQSLEPVG